FTAERAVGVYRRLPRRARQLAEVAVNRLPVRHGNLSFDFKLKQFLRGASELPPLAHQRWMSSYSGAEIAAVVVDPPNTDGDAEHLDVRWDWLQGPTAWRARWHCTRTPTFPATC